MEPQKFTWFPKLTATCSKVPAEQRGLLYEALVNYGTDGIEPSLQWPLDAIFEGLRDDIDNSKRCATNGKSGGRGNKKSQQPKDGKPPFDCDKAAFSESESTVCECEKGASGDFEKGENQSTPIQSNPLQSKEESGARFAPPSVEEVAAYCAEKGYVVDAEQFVAFYESKGWKVGRAKMKSWKAACTTWHKRHQAEGGAPRDFTAYD